MLPQNKKIGIDLDETIAASFLPLVEHINKESGRNILFEDLTHHDWEDIPHIEPRLEKNEIIAHIQSFDQKFSDHDNVLPIDGSKDTIDHLHRSGYELVAITGRNEEYARSSTMVWLNTHFPDVFTWVFFTNHTSSALRKDKSTICKELDINLMIEDNLDFALELANNGIASFLLEKPWNKQREDIHPLITRVKNWKDIRQNLLNIHP